MANDAPHKSSHEHPYGHAPEHSLYAELMCHLPYAIFSVAFSLVILSLFSYISLNSLTSITTLQRSTGILFHSFHFMHILFSATGTLITFYRFSKGVIRGFLIGLFSPLFFCALSDSIIPYIAGRFLGANMEFHLCLFTELPNILPFLIVGLINGVILGKYHRSSGPLYSIFSHSLHILISSLASTFYLVAQGLTAWYLQIGMIFLFLVVAVVVPCILSDIVTPMMFARANKKNERN